MDPAALARGELPKGASEVGLLQSRCQICHALDYITQQRLTEAQWHKTVDKMRNFGAPVSDEEVSALVAFLSRCWTPSLPPRIWQPGPPPPGALP